MWGKASKIDQTPSYQLDHCTKSHVQFFLEHFWGQWLHHFPQQTISVLDNPLSEKFLLIWVVQHCICLSHLSQVMILLKAFLKRTVFFFLFPLCFFFLFWYIFVRDICSFSSSENGVQLLDSLFHYNLLWWGKYPTFPFSAAHPK